jgi:hypothetical protein
MTVYEPINAQALHIAEAMTTVGLFRKVETIQPAPENLTDPSHKPVVMHVSDNFVGLDTRFKNPYLGNGFPIESNFASIAKEHLGMCEDKKDWAKEVRAAAKEYGHDELLDSFYEWTEAQTGVFSGKKPVAAFLRNLGQNMISRKPSVSNPLIDKTEKAIALLTENRVFFMGENRVRLAGLLRTYGLSPVNQAFAEFWKTVDEKGVQWASGNFLQRAETIIHTIRLKEEQANAQAKAVATAYQQAQENVDAPEEEEEL